MQVRHTFYSERFLAHSPPYIGTAPTANRTADRMAPTGWQTGLQTGLQTGRQIGHPTGRSTTEIMQYYHRIKTIHQINAKHNIINLYNASREEEKKGRPHRPRPMGELTREGRPGHCPSLTRQWPGGHSHRSPLAQTCRGITNPLSIPPVFGLTLKVWKLKEES